MKETKETEEQKEKRLNHCKIAKEGTDKEKLEMVLEHLRLK